MTISLLKLDPWDPGAAATTSVYLALRDFATSPSDTPANTYFEGVLEGYEFARDAFSPGRIGGQSLGGRGVLTVGIDESWKGPGGTLETLLGYGWDGHAWEMREVEGPGGAWATATQVGKGTLASFGQSGPARLQIVMHDRAEDLRKPIQANTYSGAGGFNGTAELANKPKPLVFGEKTNVLAVMVDPATLWLDVHDGQIEAIVAVRDNGIALGAAGNPPGAGQYYADLANGRILLGSIPAGEITVDVKGAKPSGVYKQTTADIIEHILVDLCGLASGDIKTGTISAMNTARAGVIGFAVGTQDRTVAEVLSDILSPFGWWHFTRDDEFELGELAAPTATAETDAAIVAVIKAYDVGPGSMRRLGQEIPPWQVIVEYDGLGRVQDGDALANAVTAANRQIYSTPARETDDSDASILNKHGHSLPLRVRSNFKNKADADTLATAILALLGVDREHMVFDAEAALTVQIGEEIWLEHADYGLSVGQAMRALGSRETHGVVGQITVFG